MIRSELDVLLDKVQDPALRADLRAQIDRIKQKRSFGLVFEQHIPERVRLPQHPIRVGSQVVARDDDDSPTYEVMSLDDGVATLEVIRDPDGTYLMPPEHGSPGEHATVDALVAISDFGEPVLPGLRYLGAVERGDGKPHHVVINGENHHALQALRFTHAGKVDCIYIDPPYNSGARDWKYNNDYVDESDAYRHSKWLAFMERRLKLARELLNPDDSVLIVTIDEKEYLRLGMLLEQTYPGSRITMVSSSVNAAGASRQDTFGRSAEYLFFVQQGVSRPFPQELGNEWNPVGRRSKYDLLWNPLIRTGTGPLRTDSPNLFYPIYVHDPGGGPAFHSVGEAYYGEDWRSLTAPSDCHAIWPIRANGDEGRWQVSPANLRDLIAEGSARLGIWRAAQTTVYYLKRGERKKIESGLFEVTGHRSDGSVITDASNYSAKFVPTDIWRITSHDAGHHGSSVLRALIPGRQFPFPKSLFAVEDTLRFFVSEKADAVVLDFFSGSGTTAHAVARLNRQDGGRRQSILITNNEVSVDEAAGLRARGLRPGDPEWEALGIFEHITRPRVEAAITGKTPDGHPIAGDYRFTDEFPMADGFEENAAFLELRYLDADDVDLGLAYDDIAPLLWLRAGGRGPIAPRLDAAGSPFPYVWTERYGVLFDEDRWRGFVADRPDGATAAFIVTYSPTVFAGVAAELPPSMDTIRLYDTYLSLFQPGRGRG